MDALNCLFPPFVQHSPKCARCVGRGQTPLCGVWHKHLFPSNLSLLGHFFVVVFLGLPGNKQIWRKALLGRSSSICLVQSGVGLNPPPIKQFGAVTPMFIDLKGQVQAYTCKCGAGHKRLKFLSMPFFFCEQCFSAMVGPWASSCSLSKPISLLLWNLPPGSRLFLGP